ncbi:MAG: YfhO family protein [Chitinophagaceae bacterium]|nr:YfhO family protein [Chitinophagaceae bacterium]
MKNGLLRKLLPHLIAIIIFLIVSVLYCKPVLDGNVLEQQDIVGWKGMAQNAIEYKAKNGHYPLWNPNLFSGMPNYQTMMEGKSILPDMSKVLTLGLPKPINFFFLACICFYILCLVLNINPAVSILVSLAYSFSTYNSVIIAAGHDTQMLAVGFIPLLMAGILCVFQKKYWIGFGLTTYATYQVLGVNHLQMSYYFFLIAVFVSLAYLYKWVKEKEWKHIGISGAIIAIAALIGLAGNALILKTTSEYSKFTMRGGKDLEIVGDSVKAAKTTGLDTHYAFEYSIGKAESATLIMPNAFGGGNSQRIGENSNVISKLTARGIDENSAIQVAGSLPRYWGSLPYTAGPAYLGVVICLLGLIGFFAIKSPLKWGLLAATVFGIFMSWGKNFEAFNLFLFEHLPLYNKFRAPSFAQFIPQLTLGIVAALSLHYLLFTDEGKKFLQTEFKKILFISGGLFFLLIILYLAIDYSSSIDSQIIARYTDKNGSDEMGRLIVSGLKEDRRAMFGSQLLRALLFSVLTLAALFLVSKKQLSSLIAIIGLIIMSTLEITIVSKPYLADEHYVSPDEYSSKNFEATQIDQEIAKDKDPDFRVFNLAADTYNESRTSYFHKSVGGYHPAKLRIYQDIIEKYLSQRPNMEVLNMLNTKYIIMQNQQSGQPALAPNPNAYGPCWLVNHVKVVNDRVESIQALGNTNLRDTAIVEKTFAQDIVQPQRDSASSIRLTKFDNDKIEYEANCNGPQFAVFSEIYYPKGWNAYLDGKKVDYVNANYILRGLSIPAGKHKIEFVFEPESVKSGNNIMFIASILILLSVIGGFFMQWYTTKNKAKAS